MVDLSSYTDRILTNADRPLFEDAVKAAKANALRAAYVMIWLSCAESLKRRFREAQKRDGEAGKIVGQIEQMEKDQKSSDKFILKKAHEYGFLSNSDHTVLNHVYEMRCIYGHPYEEAPSVEQVSHAAAAVVECVLSRPVKLRHGFGTQLLKSLLEDKSYLDDQYRAVKSFVDDILPKIDESIYAWLLATYWSKVEDIADDSSLAVFVRRGRWFSQAFLESVGVTIFTEGEWHDKVSEYPKTLVRVFKKPLLFAEIGTRAQDCLVGIALHEAAVRPSILRNLERLSQAGVLSARQDNRFQEHVKAMKASEIRSARLSTTICYGRLIDALKSYDWYIQNPAVDLVVANGAGDIADLEKGKQVELGRNILQAAQGSAGSARKFLREIAQEPNTWPVDFLRGVVLECFTNEKNEVRLKAEHLGTVLDALGAVPLKVRSEILQEVVASIKEGRPKQWAHSRSFESAIEIAERYEWAKALCDCLREKAEIVRSLEDEDAF